MVVLFGSTYFDKHYDAEALIIAGSIFVPWFTTLYFVNAANCLQPRTYYRHWNKIVYYSLAKLAVFFNIIDTTGDAKGIFNPWHGLMDSTVSSRPTLLTDMAISAGTGYKIQRSLKPAEYIEAYFKQQLG
ncbi:MAG TPA: hypothetical protein VLF21_00605 [Candidatus Saccharimonadales bacterium]|nr:hypothetical protein [Candidatus Saccharimonadales bacterium]